MFKDIFSLKYVISIVNIIIYIIVALITYSTFKKVINKIYKRKTNLNSQNQYQTILKLFLDIIRFVIIIFLLLVILSELGVDVARILAGLGIVSLVIGLAFQDLLKDIISGFSMIIEGYCSLGDTVEIKGFKGVVYSLGVKTTKIRKYDGSIMLINNREITQVINFSKDNTLAFVEFKISSIEDTDKVISILNKKFNNFKTEQNLIEKPYVLGITESDKNSVTIRVNFIAKAETHYELQRLIRKEVIALFNKEKIKRPFEGINHE